MFKIKSRKPTPGSVSSPELCRAVRERLIVRCTYGDSEERLIEPHAHGFSHAGQEHAKRLGR